MLFYMYQIRKEEKVMGNVDEKLCTEKHKTVEARISMMAEDIKQSRNKLEDIENAVIILTTSVNSLNNKDKTKNILIVIILIISILLLTSILGSETAIKVLNYIFGS